MAEKKERTLTETPIGGNGNVAAVFNNNGSVQANSGTLQLQVGGSGAGHYYAASGALLAATGATWQVKTSPCMRCLPVIVASGEAKNNSMWGSWFTIPSDAFLKSPYTNTPLTFTVQVTPHSASFQSLGYSSPAVTVYQYPPAKVGVTTQFGPKLTSKPKPA